MEKVWTHKKSKINSIYHARSSYSSPHCFLVSFMNPSLQGILNLDAANGVHDSHLTHYFHTHQEISINTLTPENFKEKPSESIPTQTLLRCVSWLPHSPPNIPIQKNSYLPQKSFLLLDFISVAQRGLFQFLLLCESSCPLILSIQISVNS